MFEQGAKGAVQLTVGFGASGAGKDTILAGTRAALAGDPAFLFPRRIITRHILPNVMSHVIVAVTLAVPSVVLLESFLGFLGFAVKPPLISWGLMLQDTGTFSVIGSYPWILSPVLFVLITVFLDMVGFGLIMPVLPKLIEDVGQVDIARAAVIGGWMFFAFSVAQFAFSPLMGNLSDRFGRRPLLLLAIAGLGADYLLQAFAPDLIWLFVGRAIAGFCGSSWIIANAYLTDVTPPEDRGRVFGLMGAAFGAGGEGHLRLCFAQSEARIREASGRLAEALSKR